MSFPIIKKYPHHSDLIFCRVPVLHTFPDNILAKYSREKYSYTEVHVFSKHNTFLRHFQFLICHALARAPGTEKGKKNKKLKALILVLGLLQVVGTVKTKGTHFSTGPTTSSRHSKNKGTHFSTGHTTSSRHSKKKKILNYRLCLHQFVKM